LILIKKTIITTTRTADGKSTTTTETTTSSSDGDLTEDFEEIEKAVQESADAAGRIGDQISKAISESVHAVTAPLDRLFRKKK